MAVRRKRIIRALLALFMAPFAMILLLGILLYLPPIQRWGVKQATDYLSRQTGVEVSIGQIRLAFPLDIHLRDVVAIHEGDTLLSVNSILVDLDMSRIMRLDIGVDAVELSGGQVHTGMLIPSVSIAGRVGTINLNADAIRLKQQSILGANVLLQNSDIEVSLHETSEEEDTTSSTSPLKKIGIQRAEILHSHLVLHLPGDSTRIEAAIDEALIADGDIHLENGTYEVQHFTLSADSVLYDLPYDTLQTSLGINPSHIRLDSINLQADSILLEQEPLWLRCHLLEGRMKERCGLQVDTLAGQVVCTSQDIKVTRLNLATPQSQLKANLQMDYSAFLAHPQGEIRLDSKGRLAVDDIAMAAGEAIPASIRNGLSGQGINFHTYIKGNTDRLEVDTLVLHMPSVADIRAEGRGRHLLAADSTEAQMTVDLHTMDLSCIRRAFELKDVALPSSTLHATARLRMGSLLHVDALATQHHGRARIALSANTKSMAYQTQMSVQEWRLDEWLPQSGLHYLTAQASAKGRGTDFLSERTSIEGQICIDSLGYEEWNLGNMGLDAHLHGGQGQVQVNSGNQLLDMLAKIDLRLQDRRMESASFSMELNSMDLHALHMAKDTLKASMKMHVEGSSDFHQTHMLKAQADHITLHLKDTTLYPVELAARMMLSPDSTFAEASAGDLELGIRIAHGIDSLQVYLENIIREIQTEMDSLRLDQEKLRGMLPTLQVHLLCGTRNPVNNILRTAAGYTFDRLCMDLNSSPEEGLRGKGYLHTLNTGAILLDTIQWDITQDADGVALQSRIRNGIRNRVVSFQSTLQARLTSTGTSVHLDYLDAKGKKGVDIGLEANVTPEGVKIHMTPLNPIIAYRRFTINEDNYIELSREGKVLALVDLLADDGTGLKIYSTPNEEALQDISLSMNNINMAELTSVMPYAPHLTGLLHGDIHYMQANQATTVSADIGVDKLTYEGTPMGDMGINAIYFPNADGSHHVDALLTQNEREIAMLAGTYREENGQGMIEGEATLEELPLSLANAFLPDGTVDLQGAVSGVLSVIGPTSNPILTGTLSTQQMHVLAEDYSVDLTIPDDTLNVRNSYLDLDHIEAYAAGKSPLTIDGSIDFSNLEKIKLSLDIAAKNYNLIDAPRSRTALTYGKVYVNMNARATGTLDNLKLRGKLVVLGNTDVTYVLRDSPITVQDQLSDIVTFCDFSDTTYVQPLRKAGQSLDAMVIISIEQAAQVHCLLSEDGSDYINLQGGGELTMTYDLENDLRLYGRYTIEQGMMRYSLMAIPLNDFSIQSGSYVEFTGNISNPVLGISASERVKAIVTENDVPRNVAFDVGLSLSQTLEDMGLTFTLEAPEDMTVQNELTAMSTEDRGRVAVTMLVTGMYMTDDFNIKNGFSYTNTLNAYLQSAINNIAGQALSTVDLSFGIENSTTSTGKTTTDYSFSFRKRFWGNRISLVVGGKVSTGEDAENTGQTIIDNVSLEYKLDNGASRYVRLFYDRNYESLIEGELTEMGVGLVLRRRTDRLRDLFRFRKSADEFPTANRYNMQGTSSGEVPNTPRKEK